ncbi:MAG: site-specific integrase [Patescibacteria group bacterium]
MTNALNYQSNSPFLELVDQLLSLFGVFLDTDGASKKTKTEYCSDIRHFLSWVQHEPEFMQNSATTHVELVSGISSQTIEKYKKSLGDLSIPASTINRRLSALRIFFRCSVAYGWIRENPAAFVANIKKPKNYDSPPWTNLENLTPFSEHLSQSGLSKEQIQTHLVNITEFFAWFKKGSIKNI